MKMQKSTPLAVEPECGQLRRQQQSLLGLGNFRMMRGCSIPLFTLENLKKRLCFPPASPALLTSVYLSCEEKH
jgi:hypothetical protein